MRQADVGVVVAVCCGCVAVRWVRGVGGCSSYLLVWNISRHFVLYLLFNTRQFSFSSNIKID